MAGGMIVYDTLRRQPVPLPLSDGGRLLKLYVCGITPYDSGHLGHAFTFCAFDLLVRHVESKGIRVRYVNNVTDVDDPLFARARHDGVEWRALAEREETSFLHDMDELGWRRPDVLPRVSQEIPAILGACEALADAGYGYTAGGSLYFEAARFADYGGLSRRSRRSMLRKLRDEELLGEVGPRAKRDWLDFPLWRPSAPDEPAWPSRFGSGRPGWHIECSAMSMRYLGEQVDVHGGGRDLVFSHHESERAQSESLTGCVPFARAWLHTGMVRYQGRKMSKSLGNLVIISDVLSRGIAPAALRLYLVSHHYRRDWSFRWERLETFSRLIAAVRGLRSPGAGRPDLLVEFEAALDDDLDTPRALRALKRSVSARDGAAARAMLAILVGNASLVPSSGREVAAAPLKP